MNARVALYSHDAVGLGHMRRNLSIAGALADGGRRSALVITGARESALMPMSKGVECMTLPALCKSSGGGYESRSLELPLSPLLRLRTETIAAAIECFAPETLIVDKHPLGICGELREVVERIHSRGRTRLVLGLREVLDEPATVRREWIESGADRAVKAFYDEVWVYGDPEVYDPVAEYGWDADIAAKVRYTGYLGRYLEPRPIPSEPALDIPPRPVAACMVGGGEDGARLAHAFVRAPLLDGTTGTLVTGPFMPEESKRSLRQAASARPDMHVVEFLREPGDLLERADSVVGMGGYNTVCELLSLGKRALIVPRVAPRLEQLIRAERMRELGLLDLLHPTDLCPRALGDWLGRATKHRPHPCETVDLGGLGKVRALLERLEHPVEAACAVQAA